MKSNHSSIIHRRDFIKDSTLAAGAAFLAGISPVNVAAYDRKGTKTGWFEDIYRLFHIDAHFGGFKEIYRNFDAEAAAQMYKEAGVQMLSYFAKCWAGYSYYPTEYGTVHPGLNRDFTGELTAALKKRGIRCVIYFMTGMERHHDKLHPEWVRNTDPNRKIWDEDIKMDTSMMCFNTPYVQEIGIPQMREIIKRYEPDGFFVDIVIQQFMHSSCFCKFCRELFDKEVGGEIPTEDTHLKAFAYRKWANMHMENFMNRVHTSLTETKSDIDIINNYTWMMRYPVTPPKWVRHITWDTPVPKVGNFSWNFSIEARYVSTVPDITWSVMNTRGNNWGEYSLREQEAFLSECATLLAACGRTYISDIPYPHGNPDPAVMEVFKHVNKRTIELEPYLKDCKPVKDATVLHSADSVWKKAPLVPTPSWIPGPAYHSVCGAHKALIEGHVQMAIVNSEVMTDTLDEFRTLILPDQSILNEMECDKIRAFVKNGGTLIATGETATRDTKNNLLSNFSLSDVFGIDLAGISDTSNCYLQMTKKNETFGIPAMDIQVMGNYTKIRTTTARKLIDLVPPYEGIKNGTPPPALNIEGPGVTINSFGKGKAIFCAAKIFESYYKESTPVQRKLALFLLDLIYPENQRMLKLENTPINIEVFYNERDDERYVHLVNYSGDKRETGVPQVQDFTISFGIIVSVRTPSRPKSLTLVPDVRKIAFDYSGGVVRFEAEPLKIHDVYRMVL